MVVFRMTFRKTGQRLFATIPFRADGIAYYARHDDEALCYAIYDHEPLAIEEEGRDTSLDENWLWDLAELHGSGLFP